MNQHVIQMSLQTLQDTRILICSPGLPHQTREASTILFHHYIEAFKHTCITIREGVFVGVPAVNIGTRQIGRDQGHNVINVGHDCGEIVQAAQKQLANGRYATDPIYGDGHAGERIANILVDCELRIQKRITY